MLAWKSKLFPAPVLLFRSLAHCLLQATKLEVPLHTVIKITYDGWSAPREVKPTE